MFERNNTFSRGNQNLDNVIVLDKFFILDWKFMIDFSRFEVHLNLPVSYQMQKRSLDSINLSILPVANGLSILNVEKAVGFFWCHIYVFLRTTSNYFLYWHDWQCFPDTWRNQLPLGEHVVMWWYGGFFDDISDSMTPRLYTSPFLVPLSDGFGSLSNSGDVQYRSLDIVRVNNYLLKVNKFSLRGHF